MRIKLSFFGFKLDCLFSIFPVPNTDSAEAFKLLQEAAKQGDADAQYNLGLMFKDGAGIAKDEVEAVRLFRKAVDQGVAVGQYLLGVMYHQGTGVARMKQRPCAGCGKSLTKDMLKCNSILAPCIWTV